MNGRERLLASLNGRAVDRPAVSFYELCEIQDHADTHPLNIYSDPSWKDLLELVWEKTDLMAMGGMKFANSASAAWGTERTWEEGDSRFVETTIAAPGRTLTGRTRRDRDIDTIWTVKHLCSDADDLRAYLELPEADIGVPDISDALAIERKIGDRGILTISVGDPICELAPLFDMGEFTILAMTEKELTHRALEKFARKRQAQIEAFSQALPGRLWRICGPEYATPPYLPPALFREYVVDYDKPLVRTIQKTGGYARLHSHGRLREVLPLIAEMGCDGLDPIEPPRQGDVELDWVRENFGANLTLFGNLEVTDIENMPTENFRPIVRKALREGTSGSGRGFVLMPAASPIGRNLAPLTLHNYQMIVEEVEAFG